MKKYEQPITEIVEVDLSSSTLDGTYDIASLQHEKNQIGGDDDNINIDELPTNSVSLWDE